MLIEMPKNILSYNAKLIGNFTARQLICGITGAGIILLMYFNVLGNTFGLEGTVRLYGAVFTGMPILLLGFVQIYDMPLEKALPVILYDNFTLPQVRYYKTEYKEATWEEITATMEELLEIEEKKKKSKKKVVKTVKKKDIKPSKDPELLAIL